MADLLLELFSEEIPARMQAQAAKDLERLVIGALSDRGLLFEAAKAFSGPRRLTLAINGLPAKQPDVSEEKKGPRINAPEKAIEGFLRSAGVTLDQCEKRDDGKGEFYVAVISRKGRDTAEVLAEALPETFAKLPWPKSMRFPGSPVRWVRPLHGIVCTLDGEVVPFEFAGVKSGDVTYGHRFLSQGPIEVRRFEDYEKKLQDAYVLIDPARRKEIIWEDAKAQAFVHNLEPIADEGLLEEVSGLAEWPVVLTGKIEDQFMDVPAEILQTSMRTHQKYFSTKDSTGKLANRFIVVANMVTKDGGKEIVAGNERVLRARLSDAKFFWDQDRQRTLESRIDDLKNITYYGPYNYWTKVDSIAMKAKLIAAEIGVDEESAKRASMLSKADLTTGIVGEFPELQGIMGGYYFLEEHPERADVAAAIRDHYKPVGPNDRLPSSHLGCAVALGDKLATLYWLFLEGERPTGSKDPFGLRRAALGIVRIIIEQKFRLPLKLLFKLGWQGALIASEEDERRDVEGQITEFIIERLKVILREKGTGHDLIDAVFSQGGEDDLVRLVARVEALQSFLKTDDGVNLLAGYKRAANILKAEEKKDGREFDGDVDGKRLSEAEEKVLSGAIGKVQSAIMPALAREDFEGAMKVMASLRAPVDAFFDKVKVNADDPAVRENRLKLLSALRASLHTVADFSKIEG